jgi:ABC-type branched-subunit amino acid transport system substrate-binding protein
LHRRSIVSIAMAGLLCTGLSVSIGKTGVAGAATSTTPIIVGGDGDLDVSPGVAQGFQAGIYRFNKAGGLDGRKIEFTGFLDDGFSAQTNLTNAQQLVTDKHVTVVAPFLSEVGTAATATFLAQSKVPFIGWAVNSAFTTQPAWGWGITGLQTNPNAQGIAGVTQLLKYTGNINTPSKLKVAFIAENIAGGITSMKALAGAFKYQKASVVYTGSQIPVIGTTSYAPYAQAIIASGANMAYEVLDSADSVGLAAALKSAGFKGTIVNGVTYFPGQLSSQPNEAAALNGVLVQDEFPADENQTPATKQAIADLVATGQPPYLVSGTSVGYWSAILLEQMLKATLAKEGGDPSKVTGATIEQTVNSGHYVYTPPLAGGINTMYFPAAESIPTGCGTTLKTTGTTFKQLYPYQCNGAVNIAKQRPYNQKTGK